MVLECPKIRLEGPPAIASFAADILTDSLELLVLVELCGYTFL